MKFQHQKIILSLIIIALLISNSIATFFLYRIKNDYQAYKIINQSKQTETPKNEKEINSNIDNNLTDQALKELEQNINNNINNNDNLNDEKTTIEKTATEDLTVGEILINWYEQPKMIVPNMLFGYFTDENNRNKISNFELSNMIIYDVGIITKGPYINKEMYLINYEEEGPGWGYMMFHIIKIDDNNFIALTKYSDEIEFFRANKTITIANLETPKTISIPDSSIKLIKADEDTFQMFADYDAPKKLFAYNDKDYIYKDDNCFIAKANDGTAREYYLDLNFIGDKGTYTQYVGNVPNILNFNWLDNKKNIDEYLYVKTNCRGMQIGCYDYVDYINNIEQLIKVGQTNNGDIFYELKDKKLKSKNYSEGILQNMYDGYYSGEEEKISFEDFINQHPIIYWQDPFGDFIEFRNAKYLQAVECDKPVIYLYPEKEMDIFVQVRINGGFSLTEPEYNDGWKVKAKPNGEIYNYGDNKIYPYLFWEGKAIDYQRPKQGFVIARQEVEQFLQTKLTLLGLIQTEIDEFIKFWLPKMQKNNFYFITFVSQEEFNQIAPLNISPRPDTIIRVFMDYEGLNERIAIEEQKISTAKRNGFTVVEWGGALKK